MPASLAMSRRSPLPLQVKPKLQEFLDLMEPVRVSLWDLYKTRKLTDLP